MLCSQMFDPLQLCGAVFSFIEQTNSASILVFFFFWLCVADKYGQPVSPIVALLCREAMLLGLASAAVQRASTGRSGRSCQQADGQVCCKVSTTTVFPVGAGADNGGKILGPNRPPVHFHTF